MSNLEALLPPAASMARKLAALEAEKASQALEQKKAAEAEKEALLEVFRRPSGVSDEEGIRRGMKIIDRAIANGLTEVQFYRFPNTLCTDRGRAINQNEDGWPETLTGVPREIYNLWHKYFREKGYKLKVQIVDFSGGVPGDIAMTLTWV